MAVMLAAQQGLGECRRERFCRRTCLDCHRCKTRLDAGSMATAKRLVPGQLKLDSWQRWRIPRYKLTEDCGFRYVLEGDELIDEGGNGRFGGFPVSANFSSTRSLRL